MSRPRTGRPPFVTWVITKLRRNPDITGTLGALALAAATVALIVVGILVAYTLVH